jgi:arylsulfatase A
VCCKKPVTTRPTWDIKETDLTNFRLYNLREDPRQEQDLSERYPERFKAMKQTMLQMHEEIVEEAIDWRQWER